MGNINLDPLAASEAISKDYRRYLASLLPMRDDALSTALEQAIATSRNLVRGPFLEATPPYAPGLSIQELVEEGVLPRAIERFSSDELPLARALYRHQELAVRKARAGRNVVVSTGTGSGKTESFLIPIIASLAEEIASGDLGPGVRAVLLYPMNALANDQVKRLRKLLAAVPEVTFGRYVGDTPQTSADAQARFREQNPGQPLLPNELHSREQMQATPPHILLTNYAMLEYLLLRPKDMDLFEGAYAGTWKFIVVDEAHVYDGARGSELAMLLRRLRNRVGGENQLQCIATSATVGAETSQEAVTAFATNLFGVPFEWDAVKPDRQDLVTAHRVALPTGTWGPLHPSDWAQLAVSTDIGADLRALIPDGMEFSDPADALRCERSMVVVREMLSDRVAVPESVARRLGDDWTAKDLVPLVDVGARVVDAMGVPVLSSRYHLWVRASEGAFACLDPQRPHVTLARHEQCDECGRPVYELASCVRCGTPYVLGAELPQSKLPPKFAPRESSHDSRTWIALSEAATDSDEDEEMWDGASPEDKNAVRLCIDCGTLNADGSTSCAACSSSALRAGSVGASHAALLTGCVACGSRSQNDVRRLDTGQDASTAVVATALYQNLPADTGAASDLPGEGRKLLIFSDSRQGAAFFAPYLETSYQRILQRRLLLHGVRAAGDAEGGPALLDDVIAHAAREGATYGLFPRRMSDQEKRRIIGLWLAQELVAMDERQSLEGLGLVRIELDESATLPPETVWASMGLDPTSGFNLVSELLRMVRRQGAVSFPSGVAPDDESFAPRLGPVYIKEHGSGSRLLSWSPADNRNNRRLDYVSRVLGRLGSSVDPVGVLSGIWRALTRSEIDDPVLPVVPTHGNRGLLRQVDYTWLRASFVAEGDTLFVCDRCKRIATVSVAAVCPAYRCDGELRPDVAVSASTDKSHYRALYRDLTPIPMSVMEHTAQWTSEEAAKIQSDFVKGKVNALSCSTTFELGVDVGELQAVLLKNVPPRTANYVQRAGRAGRRTASAALVVTMAQRRSHDLAQFAAPERMISGAVTPPVVPLGNARIDRRHAHSIVLSEFFRWAYREHGANWRSAGDFFAPDVAAVDPLLLLPGFIAGFRSDIHWRFTETLPSSVLDELGLETGGWEATLAAALADVRAEVQDEIGYFDSSRQAAADVQNYRLADQFTRVVKTIRGRDLLGFLGSRNILPKYGFPSDVVGLKTGLGGSPDGARLDLSRDLAQAIYEFAPGSQIVAGGLKWTSAGVYRLPGKELVSGFVASCRNCGYFQESKANLDSNCAECAAPWKVSEYARPEFGFVADRVAEKPGVVPPLRNRNGETHHLGGGELTREPLYLARLDASPWTMQASAKSRMFAVSTGAGAGFAICDWCGRGWPLGAKGFAKSHKHAWKDQDCSGPLARRWLAHEYETDVLTIETTGIDDHGALWSTLYALLEGAANVLDIARDDLDGTIAFSNAGARLVIFDTVPGGAGGALRVADSFDAVIAGGLRAVSECECGEETSCYSCLRGYGNQIRHDLLSRGAAMAVLSGFRGTLA